MASGKVVVGAGRCEDRRGHRKFASYGVPEWVQHPLKASRLKVALLFPGEQNHSVGMLKGVRRKPAVRAMLDAASQVFGFDLEELMLDGPAKDMAAPRASQVVAYVADCAAFEVLREENAEVAEGCQAVAGFGVGEVAALYAAGVLTFRQGLDVVRARADALQELSGRFEMEALVVRCLPLERLERHIKSAQKQASEAGVQDAQLHISQFWCPEGYVCAGRRSMVLKLQELVSGEEGVEMRLLPDHLPAAYTPLAGEACARVARTLEALLPKMNPPRCDMYLNRTGWRVPRGRSPQAFVEALSAQLAEPIQWESCVTQMLNWGIRQFYEVGPHRSLRFMLGFFDHFVEAPMEVLRPADFTVSVTV